MENLDITPQEGQEAEETTKKLEKLGKDLGDLSPVSFTIPRRPGQYEEIFGHK